MPKQYKQLKDIKLQSILELDEGPFRTECLKRWEDCGFIEGKEEVFYSFGQRFRLDGNEYILAFIGGNRAALINIKAGWTWSGLRPVSSNRGVSQAELDVLRQGADNFELIK